MRSMFTRHSQESKAVAALLLATACWGFSFPLMKALVLLQQQLMPAASVWFITAETLTVRFAISAVVMALVCAPRLRGLTWREIKLGAGMGIFAGVGTVFQMAALDKTLASTSAFLTQFYVLLLPMFVALARRKLPSKILVASCGLVVFGLGILCRVDWRNFRLQQGEWLTLLAAVLFAGDILWLDKREFVGTDKLRATVVMFVVMAALLAPLSLWTAPAGGRLMMVYRTPAVVGMLAALTVACTLVAFTLMNVWQPVIQPTHAGLVYCTEPLFASVYALFLPALLAQWGSFPYDNELVTASLLGGGALITLANVLVQYDR
jgi:drug/metabolite transporter (DMT)-like permease